MLLEPSARVPPDKAARRLGTTTLLLGAALCCWYMSHCDAANALSLPIPVLWLHAQINLSPDKASVLREVYRVLKPGGKPNIWFCSNDLYRQIAMGLRICELRVLLLIKKTPVPCAATAASHDPLILSLHNYAFFLLTKVQLRDYMFLIAPALVPTACFTLQGSSISVMCMQTGGCRKRWEG